MKYLIKYEKFKYGSKGKYWKIKLYSNIFLKKILREIGLSPNNRFYKRLMNFENKNEYVYLSRDDISKEWMIFFESEKDTLEIIYPNYIFQGIIEPSELEIKMDKFNI